MLNWPDVLNLARNGNPAPDRKVIKTDAEWREQLGPEEYRVTRQAGTERPFSSQMCGLFEAGIYSCLCCETVLFDAIRPGIASSSRWARSGIVGSYCRRSAGGAFHGWHVQVRQVGRQYGGCRPFAGGFG